MSANVQATTDARGAADAENCYRVEITLAEADGIARHGESVTVGIPLDKAKAVSLSELALVDAAGQQLANYHFNEAARWPDGSLKWVHLYFSADIGANENQTLFVTTQSGQTGNVVSALQHDTGLNANHSQSLSVTETGIRGEAANSENTPLSVTVSKAAEQQQPGAKKSLRLETTHFSLAAEQGERRFKLFTPQGALICDVELHCRLAAMSVQPVSVANAADDAQIAASAAIGQAAGESETLPIKSIRLLDSNPVFSTVELLYDCFYPASKDCTDEHVTKPVLTVQQVLKLHHVSGALQQTITLHNPGAAMHSGGFWDLGGAGSVLLEQFDLIFVLDRRDSCQVSLSPDAANDMALSLDKGSDFSVYQESSGGENWQSRVHANRDNKVPLQTCGHKVMVNGIEQNSAQSDGQSMGGRAEPIVYCSSGETGFGLFYRHFWQAFPSSLSVNGNVIAAGLLPGEFPDRHEIQGGEKLCKEIWSSCSDSIENLHGIRQPLMPMIAAQHWQDVPHLLFFDSERTEHPLQALIEESLNGENDFFTKRETYDEYGWRNFGELFADHESWLRDSDEDYFVSHYNNQYDAIYGFGLQYLLTGDRRWFELMGDRARHVVHIDLYNTKEDREDHNGGPFWHTDHYMDAYTASHRAHSLEQRENDGKPVGGCFSPEHCYTNGLTLHYFLTGNLASRDAVLSLSNWVLAMENGGGSLIGTLQRVAGRELVCIKQLVNKGETYGYYHYFNRGTGNMIINMVNSYEVTGDSQWLKRAEQIIRESIHYRDDIDKRTLLKAERRWSYVVLLFAITRYLGIKELEGSMDKEYWYAREAFVSYSRWMLEHEVPYLQNSEDLVHVNNTWTAQDARKCYLLLQAAFYDPSYEDAYREKAEQIMAYVLDKLGDSDELSYTRIQVVLLQSFCRSKIASKDADALRHASHAFDLGSPPAPTIANQSIKIAAKLGSALLKFSPMREYRWLKTHRKFS